jgi:hypothetical protein
MKVLATAVTLSSSGLNGDADSLDGGLRQTDSPYIAAIRRVASSIPFFTSSRFMHGVSVTLAFAP